MWIEPVSDKFITDVRSVPNIDNECLNVNVSACGTGFGDYYEVLVKEGNTEIASGKAVVGEAVDVA